VWWQADTQGLCCGLASGPLLVWAVTVVTGRKARALASSRLCSVGRLWLGDCGGGPIGNGVLWSRISSVGRRGLFHCGGGRIGNCVGQVSPLILWSAWDMTLCWRAIRQGRWSGLASFPLVGVGCHCDDGSIGIGVGLASLLFHWSASAQLLWCGADRQVFRSDRSSVLWLACAQSLLWQADRHGRCSGLPLFLWTA
jgi:hypothetical protein